MGGRIAVFAQCRLETGQQVGLRPGGRGLLHFIGRSEPTPTNSWFERRIFPGAALPALSQALATLESSALVPVDIENLRRHYIRTLEHWLERFEKSSTRIEAEQGPEFTRSWRLMGVRLKAT